MCVCVSVYVSEREKSGGLLMMRVLIVVVIGLPGFANQVVIG